MTNVFIIRSVVVLLAIFVTGLLAGVMLGVAMEQQTAQKLPEAAWTLRQQNDDALFRKVMPFTFITMMLLLIASIFLLHGLSRIGHGRCDSCRASGDHRDRRVGSTYQQ
jgi:Na+/H+ antiporter NhaB